MKLCFVIMPIGSGEAYEVYFNRYANIIKPAVEGYQRRGSRVFDAIRADFITKTGSINKSVIQHIYNADLLIADLTDLNPNVFYELGVRHALRNGTILVALEGTKLPFDVGDLRAVFYRDRVGGEKDAIAQIQRMIGAILDVESPDDSPVFAALPTLAEPQTRDLLEAKAKASAAEATAAELRVKLSLAEDANLRLHESFTTFERTINTVLQALRPKDREAAEEAVERAVKARAEQLPTVTRHLPGVQEITTAVFVLIPFRSELTPIYEIIREASQRAGLRTMPVDQMAVHSQITSQMSDFIARAGLIVADITNWNSNVLYGIGTAIALGKQILIISQNRGPLPFEIAHQPVIFYDNTIPGAEQLRDQLTIAMKRFAERAG